ncbi:MAG: hypothetical protein KC482_10235 [Dehalococcoidia bacterium]|nr:hypothetical protein [Dehalococcoidia bacterium]MCA9853959.1 hypothetical protein [Dehalococcoidia bacterium]
MGTRRVLDITALTAREQEVAALMARGQTNGEIAEQLGITFNTAKWHVSQVIAKLDVSTREEAVAVWRRERSLRRRLTRALAPLGHPAGRIAAVAAVVTVLGLIVTVFLVLRDGGDDVAGGVFGEAAPGIYVAEILLDGEWKGPGSGEILRTGSVRVRNADSGDVIYTSDETSFVRIAWSPTGSGLLAVKAPADDGTRELVVFAMPDFERSTVALNPMEQAPNFAWSPDGSAVAISVDTELVIFSDDLVELGRRAFLLEGDNDLGAVRWSPDSRLAAVAANDSVVVIDRTGAVVARSDLVTALGADPAADTTALWSWEGDGSLVGMVFRGIKKTPPPGSRELFHGRVQGSNIEWEPQPFATGAEAITWDHDRLVISESVAKRGWEAMGLTRVQVGGHGSGRTQDGEGWYISMERDDVNGPVPAGWPDGEYLAIVTPDRAVAIGVNAVEGVPPSHVLSIVIVPG